MRLIVCVLIKCSIVVLCALDLTAPGQERSREIPVKGRYANYDYAYSVRVPKGLVGFMSPAPFPNHGFGIDLSKKDKAYLFVDASYNAAELKSLSEAIDVDIGFLKNETSTNIRIVKRASTVLSNLRAVRFVVHYDSVESRQPMIRDTVLAFRSERGGVGIVYTIQLVTPVWRYEIDKPIVTQVQKSWTLRPLP